MTPNLSFESGACYAAAPLAPLKLALGNPEYKKWLNGSI